MTNKSINGAAAAVKKQWMDGGSFFVFLNSYRWLNWVLAVVLLVAKVAPPTPIAITISVYSIVFIYNAVFTWRSRDIERILKRYPALIAVDIVFCFAIVFVYGWRSPFTAYGFSPVMIAGFLFGMGGAFGAAALCAAGYGLSVMLRGPALARIVSMGLLDQELFQGFDYFLVAIFFSYPASLAKKLRQSNTELVGAQAEIERLTLAKERRRLAGDIHDSVIQSLHSANLLLSGSIKESLQSAPKVSKRLTLAKEALDQALTEIGLAVDDLFEDKLGARSFCQLAREAVEAVEDKHKIAARFCARGREVPCSGEAKKALCLIVQEALSNTVKHSGAGTVDLNIDFSPEGVTLCIGDDGHGFDTGGAGSDGHGLDMISARARELGGASTVDSAAGRGTVLTIVVPTSGLSPDNAPGEPMATSGP